MIVDLLFVAVLVCLVVFLIFFYRIVRAVDRYVASMCGIAQDKAVDEFFRKAVIIAVDSYRKDKAVGEELEKKIIERSSAIVTDVLLQHGLSPRQYNLEGLVKVTMAKLGLIPK